MNVSLPAEDRAAAPVARRTRSRALLLVSATALLLLLLAACRAVEPPPSVPPVVPPELADAQLHFDLDAALLARDDLPAGFQPAAREVDLDEAVVLYLRPAALEPGASGGNSLLSVLVSISVYTTTAEAEGEFARLANDATGQAVRDVARISDAATQIEMEPAEGGVEGAGSAESYRVQYRILDQRVFDYGHRFRMGNTVVSMVVSALGTPNEPVTLHSAAQKLVQRQLDRIADAVAGTPPSP